MVTFDDLVAEVAARTDWDTKTTREILRGLATVVVEKVADGGRVSIPGLGVFYRKHRARGVQLPTGEVLPETASVGFRAGTRARLHVEAARRGA